MQHHDPHAGQTLAAVQGNHTISALSPTHPIPVSDRHTHRGGLGNCRAWAFDCPCSALRDLTPHDGRHGGQLDSNLKSKGRGLLKEVGDGGREGPPRGHICCFPRRSADSAPCSPVPPCPRPPPELLPSSPVRLCTYMQALLGTMEVIIKLW